MSIKDDALIYHERTPKGKTEIRATKPCLTQQDLTLAYSPGVAYPCLEIAENKADVYKYTNKGNLVAVLSNGTAVLGLGNIGPQAFKPVGEGKAVLFKKFGGVDAFDLELAVTDPDAFIAVAKALEPTFGGINLEDIKAPECFVIEERLKAEMRIPVFHDDQWGTAIITGAGLINGLDVQGKSLSEVRTVIAGAGAAGIAMARHLVVMGHRRESIILIDSRGIYTKGREGGRNKYKDEFAHDGPEGGLAEALEGADVFLGVSVANTVTPEMLKSMAPKPIIFAMANPDPEIPYDEAKAARPDAIVGTGRSDYPNQVNNVLGFPFIFRGALDVAAKGITSGMMVAASQALADLAREPVPVEVQEAYGQEQLAFGPDYVIPKPTDRRVLFHVAPAVAAAAIAEGLARREIDTATYRGELERLVDPSRRLLKPLFAAAKKSSPRIIFPEGHEPVILQAAEVLKSQGIATPILVGKEAKVAAAAAKARVDLTGMSVHDPRTHPRTEEFAKQYHQIRQRKGITPAEAHQRIKRPVIFASMQILAGEAAGLIVGQNLHYRNGLIPILQVLPLQEGVGHACGAYAVIPNNRELPTVLLGDATIQIRPGAADLAEIGCLMAGYARRLGLSPVVAFLGHANFGASQDADSSLVRAAVAKFKEKWPAIPADGEMQADTALSATILGKAYPFSDLAQAGPANVLVCPNLDSANIAYKLLSRLGEADLVGPILLGMEHPVHVLQRHSTVGQVVEMATLAAAQAAGGQSA